MPGLRLFAPAPKAQPQPQAEPVLVQALLTWLHYEQALTRPMASQQPARLSSRVPWLKRQPQPVLSRPQASERGLVRVVPQRPPVARFRTQLVPAGSVSARLSAARPPRLSAARPQWVAPQLAVPQLAVP